VKIIVVDSDRDMGALIGFALHQSGYEVQEITPSANVLPTVLCERPHAVVIAVEQVSIDAICLCQAIRSVLDTPIILINRPPREDDEIAALDMGADVYMSPPLDLRMLCARVRALVRRMTCYRRPMHNTTYHKGNRKGALAID
jgi:DNA-binding response OmpR family regulator